MLWGDFCDYYFFSMFKDKVWIFMGDFNDILKGDESTGFLNFGRFSTGMRDF